MRKVFVRYREDLPESECMFAAAHGFRLRGVETVPFHGFGDIESFAGELGPDVGIVGFVGDVLRALELMGRSKPEPLDYPIELFEFFGRQIWPTTLGNVRLSSAPLFVKPQQHKRFTGFVFDPAEPLSRRRAVTEPDDVAVWCSDPVQIESEYRVFVLNTPEYGGELGVRFYKGQPGISPNMRAVREMVSRYRSAPAAYSLDVGVTQFGSTILVEANDAFALGNYGLPGTLYAQLIEARWRELCGETSP